MLRQFEHIAIRVRSLEESISFYRDLLGFRLRECVDEPDEKLRVGFVELNGVELELLDYEGEEPAQEAANQALIPHIAFRVDDLMETSKMMEKKGISFQPGFPKKVLGDRYLIAFFNGPNGEILEILQRLK